MGLKAHSFTRDDVTYDCVAYTIRPASHPRQYQWHALARGIEHPCFRFTGREFATKSDREMFEANIIEAVRAAERMLDTAEHATHGSADP